MTPSLDIVIVNWNSGSLLSECISTISTALKESFLLGRVVVVDNASGDNSLANLGDTNLNIEIIRNNENLGFARACNQGARGSFSDFILFLNPDTRLFEDSLSSPINFMLGKNKENIGILGVQLINENNIVSRNCARFPTFVDLIAASLGLDKIAPRLFKSHFMHEWDHLESRAVDQVMGSYFLIRRILFERLNGYDESFFVYYEDLDLALRAKEIGYLNYYYASAKIYHKGGGISEKVKDVRTYYVLKSKLIYSKKHFSKFSFLLIFLTTLIFEPIARIAKALFTASWNDIKEICSAYKMLYTYLISGPGTN